MTAKALSCLVLLLVSGIAAAAAPPASTEPAPLQNIAVQGTQGKLQAADSAPAGTPAPLMSRLTQDVIREAIRDTIAEPSEKPQRLLMDTLRVNNYGQFSQQFSEARVPDCMHGDALKRQPPKIGPIALGGLFAIPFVVVAKARGKCN